MHIKTLFETLRTINNGSEYLWLEAHLERLKKSIGKGSIKQTDIIKSQLLSLLPFSQEKKIQVFISPFGASFKIANLKPLPDFFYTNGVRVQETLFERPEPRLKYQTEVYQAYGQPEDENWFETLFVDRKGFLREGNITNIFFLIENQWVTPPRECCFPGLMRQWFLKEVQAKERWITKKEALTASEIILTNSVKGLISVKEWNEQKFTINNKAIIDWNQKARIF